MLTRRGFIAGGVAAATVVCAAPALANIPTIWADGVRSDSDGLEAWANGKPYRVAGAVDVTPTSIRNGTLTLSRTLYIPPGRRVDFGDLRIRFVDDPVFLAIGEEQPFGPSIVFDVRR